MAEISVIVPVFNVEPYLRRCVDSILSQSFHSFELILIDDGSPDKCGEICDDYARIDTRIHVIHQMNRGLSAARNAGLKWSFEKSDSEWITFVDSDDWIHPLYLELLMDAVKDNDLDVAIGGYFRTYGESFPELDESKKKAILRRADDYYVKSIVNATVSWGKLFRKNCYKNIRFPVGKIHEDEFTTYRILFLQEYVAVIDQPLYAYFQNEKGIMMREWTPQRLDALSALEEQISYFLKTDRKDVAKIVFKRLINNINRNRQMVKDSATLSVNGKKNYEKYLIKKMRTLIIRYRKYGLFPFMESESNKQVYMIVFPGIRPARVIWGKVKAALKWFPVTHYFGKLLKLSVKKRHDIRTLINYIKQVGCKRSVLLQSPLHGNLGDQAIILAELSVLRQLQISHVDFPWTQGIEKHIAKVTPRKRIILQQGGGNLGQLWPEEENRFRASLQAFKKNKIIVFPQTIFFDLESKEGRDCLEESKAIYESHPDLTIFVRERYSYDFMKKHMAKVHVEIVPDMAMLLKWDVMKSKADREGILLCLRSDKEKTISPDDYSRLLKSLSTLDKPIIHTDTVISGKIDITRREQMLSDKLSEFESSSLVITDRLHGMIFAAITETPCIVIESLSHKIRGCYDWLKDLDYIRLVENVDEVPQMIGDMVNIIPKYNRRKIEEAMKPLYEILQKAN